MIELAVAGTADVVSRNEAGSVGFLVPHSDPQHRPELIERYSFGWCNGSVAVVGRPASWRWPATVTSSVGATCASRTSS
jgi:hypothetical protein